MPKVKKTIRSQIKELKEQNARLADDLQASGFRENALKNVIQNYHEMFKNIAGQLQAEREAHKPEVSNHFDNRPFREEINQAELKKHAERLERELKDANKRIADLEFDIESREPSMCRRIWRAMGLSRQ